MSFIDARDLPEGTDIEADIVIIGGGMAGIAIAREWTGSSRTVAVIESGGREFDEAAQDLYAGTGVVRAPGNEDFQIDSYLFESRYRALGGSGNIWGGKCVPLDPADFEKRDWLPMTGWPLTRAELQPYYDRACALLEIPAFPDGEVEPEEEGRPPLRIHGDFFAAPRRFTHLSGAVDKAAFDQFRTGFAEAANIRVYLNANVREILAARSRRKIDGLDIACLNGKRHRAKGRGYILAAGGIENVRLLLASNSTFKNGVGNESDHLGRYFQGHVTYGVYDDPDELNTGLAISDAERAMALYTDNGRDKLHCVIASTLEGQRRFKTGNFTTTLFNRKPPQRQDIASLFALAGRLDHGQGATPQNLACFFMSEQFPNPESRITLDPARDDALGMPRVRLEWVYSQKDIDTLEASIAGLAAALGAEGLGRVCWPVAASGLVSIMGRSRHHMGTTRMHKDAEHGVVDEDCRIHGISNLYVAGSSVFPTSGIANPTLTLLALAIRLSDHLKRRMGK